MSRQCILIAFLLFLSLVSSSSSSDTLTPEQSLAVNQTLISAGQRFELGFFSLTANKFYLGIWYCNLPIRTVVWVANRESPARNSSSVSLNLGTGGQIIISEQDSSGAVWSSNKTQVTNPVLQLLDSGNLVIRDDDDSNSENYVWQSFDYPTDTSLSGMKVGWDKKSGLDRFLTSWKSSTDPSPGGYTYRLDRAGDPEIFVFKGGTQKIYRTGPWVGKRFSGSPPVNTNSNLRFTFQDIPGEEVFYVANESDPTMRSRLVMDTSGSLHRYMWVANTWKLYWFLPKDQCDQYMACGPYGVCDASQIYVCGCPRGFGPRNQSEWAQRDASSGCTRNRSLDCATDGFVALGNLKLPDSGEVVVDREKGLDECRMMCKKDCNCTAYSSWQVVDGVESGCLMWSGDLKDMRKYPQSGQTLYVRVDASDSDAISDDSDKTKKVAIGVSVGVVMLSLTLAACFVCKRKRASSSSSRASRRSWAAVLSKRELSIDSDADELELPLYDLEEVLVATNHFSHQNKLGEGGFGHVYKGVLKEGEEVAIKRLSKDSGQGSEEFKNEVKVIAKLQHRNLVRLVGCCVEGDEKMLVYEYLPNRSLDTILFHKERRSLFDWPTRFNIICGIARGLQYLHHDSRLRIIHRDLKSSNILLDEDMNPKISDFGMARIFGGDETALNNTRRVVGTYGYMAPEYAMYGTFSIKSDVFSFGVLVLEIISGKANTRFYNSHDELNLLGHAWKMLNEGTERELVDPSLGDSYSITEVERCIQIGLLCVQERAEERPNMLSVVVSLSSETAPLAQPKLPGFCLGTRPATGETDSSSSQQNDTTFSLNQVTVSVVEGR